MANIKSAKKRVQVSERNRLRNVAVRSEIKTAVKKVYDAIKNNSEEEIKASVSLVYKLMDKAVTKGILHKNSVARRKSRLVEQVKKAQASQ